MAEKTQSAGIANSLTGDTLVAILKNNQLETRTIMTNIALDPPRIGSLYEFDESFEGNRLLEFYIAYDYLPIRNFIAFTKNVNELYELVYYILYGERVPSDEILVIEHLATGNSVEGIIKLLEKAGVTRKGFLALSIVIGLIGLNWVYNYQLQAKSDLNKTRTEIEVHQSEVLKNQAEQKKALAETKKAEAETNNLNLEKILIQNKIKQDSINRIKNHKEAHKIFKKARAIDRSVKQAPINLTVINSKVIFGDNNTMLE